MLSTSEYILLFMKENTDGKSRQELSSLIKYAYYLVSSFIVKGFDGVEHGGFTGRVESKKDSD